MDSSGTGSTGQQKLPTSITIVQQGCQKGGALYAAASSTNREFPTNQFCYMNMTKAMQAHDYEH
jgi:hypothetical protein